MRLLDLLKAAAGEGALSSRLGVWRQHVSQDLDSALALLGIDPDGGGAATPASGISVLATYGSFYALMGTDNAAPVAQGAPLLFPNDGPANIIDRDGASPGAFILPAIGTYEVFWQASVTEAGQLMLDLNGAPLANTVAGRATGTSQIMNRVVITTTAVNSVLRVINPAGNAAALTITVDAGGAVGSAASAWLVIRRLA